MRRLRFTPTGVGKSTKDLSPGEFAKVHPHGRGEIAFVLFPIDDLAGSPPRAWGNRQAVKADLDAERFTPTGVGKSFALFVHVNKGIGSPPRAWGNLF